MNIKIPKTKNKGDSEDEYEIVSGFPVNFIPDKSGTWYIDIYGPIISPSQFSDAITILNNVDKDSTIVFNLQTGGGSLHAADTLIHAIRKTNAHVHFVASLAHSAGSLLLLEADSFELTENFCSLIHNGSLGSGGNYNEFVSSAEFNAKFMKRALTNAYQGFLTEKEIEDLLMGRDFWLDAAEWIERVTNRNAWMEAKYDAVEVQEIIQEEPPKLKKPVAKKKAPVVK